MVLLRKKQLEDCYDEVVKFCDRELGVAIERSEIDRAHRIGKPQHDDGRPRAINREFKFDFQYQYRYQCFHFRSHFGTGNFKALSYHDR